MDALILRASPNSLSAARSLGRAGLEVAVAATEADPAILASRYVARLIQLPAIDDCAVDSLLAIPTDAASKPFLLATGDQDALLLARHQERLADKYCFVTPSFEVLTRIIDKATLYEIAKEHQIPHPRFHVVRDAADIEAAIESVGAPCYVKPAMSHEWRRHRRGKLAFAANTDDLRRILLGVLTLGLVAIAIEIIPGSDGDVHSVSTYIGRNRRSISWRTKRKIRQFPLGAGDGCAQEITDQPEVAALGLRLLDILGHCGPATVEFRRDARDGRFVLMEVNARTILGQEMITRSGLDAPLLAYHDATGRPLPEPGKARRVHWLFFGADFRAFRELRKRGLITTLQWLRTVAACRCFAYFALDDPAPFLARIALWLRRRMTSKILRDAGASL
jgi:D-aspartate ligase